jgi:hypothetical protein
VCLSGCQREPDRQAIGIDDRMKSCWSTRLVTAHGLPSVPSDAGTVLMHADNGRVDHLHGGARRPPVASARNNCGR